MSDPGHEIAQWIGFKVAPSDNPQRITSSRTDAGVAWKNIMRPLLDSQGRERTLWGSSFEDPCFYLLVVVWETFDHAQHFEASDAGRQFWELLVQRCVLPPTSSMADFDDLPFYISLLGYTEVVMIYFNPENYASHMEDAQALKGITRKGQKLNTSLWIRRGPSQGRVFQTTPMQDESLKIIVCHHWLNPDAEQDVKQKLKSDIFREAVDWHARITAAGASSWKELHITFARLSPSHVHLELEVDEEIGGDDLCQEYADMDIGMLH